MLGLALICVNSPARADRWITVRLSFKVIVDTSGDLPPDYDEDVVYRAVREMDDFMDHQSRGIRFVAGPYLVVFIIESST